MRLDAYVIVRCKALVHEKPGSALGLEGTDIRRLENGAQRPLGGDRVLADELPVRRRRNSRSTATRGDPRSC